MGAQDDSGSFEVADPTPDNIMDEAERLIEQAKYDHGHSGYSGTIAECPSAEYHEIRKSADEAWSYFFEHPNGGVAKKWENMIVVQDDKNDNLFHYGAVCSS